MPKSLSNRLVLPILALCCALGGITTLFAIDTSSALYTSNIQLLNLGITRQNFAGATEISGAALIDDSFMAVDTLNAVVHEGPVEIPSMPPNNRIVVQDFVLDDGGSFTDWQTEARDAIELDFPLLPAAPAVDDAAYFACDNPCRIITVNIGQEAIADTLEVDWEYFNGTAFVTASNVDDRTFAFTRAGLRTVSFDMPSDMATTSVTGSAVVGDTFWVRARVTSVDNPTQQAVGNQAWYENGQWWMWGKTQSINQELLYNLSVGGPDLVTNHQILPGDAGIITPDDPSIELGDTYAIHFGGAINFTAGITGSDVCIVCKDDAIRLWISDVDEVTLDITGAGSTQLVLSGIPDVVDLPTSTSPHILDVISDATTVTLSVNGVGSVSGTAQSITDNANDYSWGSGQGFVFADTIYILPDDTSLAFALFDTETEWDTGTFSDTQSTAGQPDESLSYMPGIAVEDGMWDETTGNFFNNLSLAIFGNLAGDVRNSFFRFDNVQIPQGATIASAHLQLVPQAAASGVTVNALISAIDEDDAAAPSSTVEAEADPRTTAVVSWAGVPAWAHASHVTPSTEDTPDISAVIQEIVDRPGWAAGNGIVIFIEDDGSSANANRFISTVEEHHSSAQLRVTLAPSAAISDDFVELESSTTVPLGWTRVCGTCSGSWLVDDTGARNGKFGARPNNGPTNNSFEGLQQDLTASEGEVWSASVQAVNEFNSDNGEFRLYMIWLDSGGATISQVSADVPSVGTPLYASAAINGQTAPAGTVTLRIRMMEESCGVGGCSGNSFPNLWDGVMACVCAVAPTFPDSSNRLTNPSFEIIYQASGTWVTPTINLTQTSVISSSVVWDAIEPTGTSLIVETSIDGQATWQTATNGGAISGIAPGDDVSGLTLHIRLSLAPNSGDENIYSPSVGTLAAIVSDDVPEASTLLFYQLRTTPGVTIEDLSPNANDGTMSYPLQLAGIFSAITPFQSTRIPLNQQAAIGVGDFAAPVTGSAANLNLFGDDTGAFLPGAPVVIDAFDNANLPLALFWSLIVFIIGIGAGAAVWKFSNGNTWATTAVLCGTLVIASAVGDGLIPGWVPFVAIMLYVPVNILRSRLPI